MEQKKIDKLLSKNNGVIKTADVMAAGIAKASLYQYVKSAGLEKIAHGIYLAPDAWADELYLLQAQFPQAVYSHETALYLHDLAEKEPMPPTVTVAAKYNSARLMEKGIKIVYVKKEWHEIGRCEIISPGGHAVTVYNMERTICDIVRRRYETDAAVFAYAVKEYARKQSKNLSLLMEYAYTMRIEQRIREIMEVLL